MTEQEYLSRIHTEILEIMDDIHAICTNNHIAYYLTGGSLLGAVRHKGFIPWDDDLDIAMPRADYERFFEICKTSFQGKYETKNIDDDIDYAHIFSKLCKRNTLFSERLSNGHFSNNGIYVDVFPLDETDGNTIVTVIRRKLLGKVQVMIAELGMPGYLTGVKSSIAHLFSREFLLRILRFLLCMTNNKGKCFYTNFASQYSVERKTQLRSVYGKGTPIAFEDRIYMAPDDFERDLLSNFGPKYMELPPVEKRRTHYPQRVIFSDGAVFEPQSIYGQNEVSVEESINW